MKHNYTLKKFGDNKKMCLKFKMHKKFMSLSVLLCIVFSVLLFYSYNQINFKTRDFGISVIPFQYSIYFIAFIILIGLYLFYIIFGKEIVVIDCDNFIIIKNVFFFNYSKKYNIIEIKSINRSSFLENSMINGTVLSEYSIKNIFPKGLLYVTINGKKIFFGGSITCKEADYIVFQLKSFLTTAST